jgi:D-xylose reductase
LEYHTDQTFQGVDYFDLYIIHFPLAIKYVDPSVRYPPSWNDEDGNLTPIKAPLHETWAAFESLYEKKLAKNIGISNYSNQTLIDLTRYAKVIPQTLQIEHHPYLVQQQLLDICKAHNIHITAYSSFGPSSYHELDMQRAKDTPLLLEHDLIKKIADKHGKTTSQVLLRWSTQRGIAVIPKSNNQGRLQQNLDVTNFDLEKSEIEQISALDLNKRFNAPINYGLDHPDLLLFG